jgi:hypothetical protein
MTKNRITSFEVIDHGYDHAQYFQGCGTSFTSFEHVATGCGSTQKEAYDNALDQIAGAYSVDVGRLVRHGNANYSRVRIPAEISKAYRTDNMCEVYYYLSIRFNLPAQAQAEYDARCKEAREAYKARQALET